jgi:hypothetical protein
MSRKKTVSLLCGLGVSKEISTGLDASELIGSTVVTTTLLGLSFTTRRATMAARRSLYIVSSAEGL